MTSQTAAKNSQILYQKVVGSKRFSNFFWSIISAIGGVGFLLAGLSSYLSKIY